MLKKNNHNKHSAMYSVRTPSAAFRFIDTEKKLNHNLASLRINMAW